MHSHPVGDVDAKYLTGVARETLRARILAFLEKYNCKRDEIRVVMPRLWLEGVAIEPADVEGVAIEFRRKSATPSGDPGQ